MDYQKDKVFYIDFEAVKYIYPGSVSRWVKEENFGVLKEYEGKKYSLGEINEIIAQLIKKMPYIPNSMELSFRVMFDGRYYHSISIKNLEYEKQDRSGKEIQFLF